MNKSFDNVMNFIKSHRYLSIFIISTIFISSLAVIGLIYIISPLFEVPDFSLSTLTIKKVEEGSVYADFTFIFSKPIKYEISIKKISIKLYQENGMEKSILAEGYTLTSFVILKNAIFVENISFIFEVPRVDNLLTVLLKEEKIGIMGVIYFPIGFSTSFSYQPKNIGTSILPSIEILEVHPVPPGSILDILVTIYNPHDITLNLTEGTFNLIALEYGSLGNVSLTNISIPSKVSNLTLSLETDTNEMTWLFEKILNNGTLQVEIHNFDVIFWFGSESIDIFLEKGPSFIWGSYDPGLKVLGLENVSYSLSDETISFDVRLGLYGNPLWGYNVSAGDENPWSISLDFYHIVEDDLQIVGNGSTNMAVTVNRSEISPINVHINVFPFAALEMIFIWITEWNIDIDIQNGCVCLQFYNISLQIRFERHL